MKIKIDGMALKSTGRIFEFQRLLLMLITLFMVACGKDLPLIIPEPSYSITKTEVNGTELFELSGIINDSLYLGNERSYLISGKITISKRGILNISEGCKIYARVHSQTYLLVEREGRLIANGTENKPIVFTSLNSLTGSAAAGDWVGLHINGQAIINERSSSLTLEIGKYGRLETELNEDNSGKISFIRVEFAGEKLGNTQGAFNLNGIGSKTQIDHIQTYRSLGSGIRIRGGEVNLSQIISTQSIGNGIRWEGGWTGKGQYWVVNSLEAIPDTITLLVGGSSDVNNQPRSNPTLSNITLLGRADIVSRGIRLSDATLGRIYNMIIKNTNRAVRVDNAFNDIIEGNIFIKNSLFFENEINFFDNSTSTASIFASQEFNNSFETLPMSGYIGSSNIGAIEPRSIDGWFQASQYKGAVQNLENDWTKNWTRQ